MQRKRSGFRRRRRGADGDGGMITALEGTFVGVMLVASVAVVTSLDVQPPAQSPSRANLQATLQDILDNLEYLPTGDRYAHMLEKGVSQAVVGNTGPLDRILKQTLPAGSECRLGIDNGRERRVLAGSESRGTGESVSASRLYHPKWAYAFVVPTFEYISDVQPLQLQGFGVSQGALVKEAGVPLQVDVYTSSGIYPKGAVAAVRPNEPTVSLLLKNAAGTAGYSAKDPLPIGYPLVPLLPMKQFTLVVREEGGGTIKTGTNVTIRLPFSLNNPATDTPMSQDGWTKISTSTDSKHGKYVSAELSTDIVPGGSREFTFGAPRVEVGAEPIYVIEASLSNGTTARSNFIIGLPLGLTKTENPVQRTPYLSLAKPMAPGTTATWGVLFPYPAPTGLGAPETITRIEVYTTNGAALFGGVDGLGGAGTWTMPSASKLVWTGSVSVLPNDFAAFRFNVTATTLPSPNEPRVSFPVDFATGAKFQGADMVRPYIYELSVPPGPGGSHGYEVPTMQGAEIPMGKATLGVDWIARAKQMKGNASYTVTPFALLTNLQENLRLGVARSHLNLSTTTARIGEQVTITIDFQGLYDQVATSLNLLRLPPPWEVGIHILDPAQPFQAWKQWNSSYSGYYGSSGSAQVQSTPEQKSDPLHYHSYGQYDDGDTTVLAPGAEPVTGWKPLTATVHSSSKSVFKFVVPKGSFYGPHTVLAEAKFFLKDGLGKEVLQTARMVAVLDVVPDGGQSETALYWVNLECWIPDW